MSILFIISTVALLVASIMLWVMLRAQKSRLQQMECELSDSRDAQHRLELALRSAEVELQGAEKRAEEQRQRELERRAEAQQREQQQREQFKNLANDIIKEQTKHLREGNQESMASILTPFKENITQFKERVETIYNFENEQRGALRNELERLLELNRRITTETQNLTNALKGNSKVQGDWGEMILETILESSNLVKGTHYFTQSNYKDEEGANVRPDVVLSLPEGKQIIIDSKTSLTAFVNYVGEEDAARRRHLLDAHIVSVRQHIRELAAKEYQKLVNSPDFVIMFIPSEPAFLAALQADNTLWTEAYDKRVIISSPTNLFALLKLVDDLWKRNAQSQNTAEIVKRGTKLYEQLARFVASMEGVGVALDQARTKYDDAYKRLATGNDNIIRNGERLRKLGLATKVQMSQKALDGNDMDDGELSFDEDHLIE